LKVNGKAKNEHHDYAHSYRYLPSVHPPGLSLILSIKAFLGNVIRRFSPRLIDSRISSGVDPLGTWLMRAQVLSILSGAYGEGLALHNPTCPPSSQPVYGRVGIASRPTMRRTGASSLLSSLEPQHARHEHVVPRKQPHDTAPVRRVDDRNAVGVGLRHPIRGDPGRLVRVCHGPRSRGSFKRLLARLEGKGVEYTISDMSVVSRRGG
jgi:hypothetical protein